MRRGTKRLVPGAHTSEIVLDGYLTGQLLIAMPGMRDTRFQKSVVYLCAHGPQGAFGLVVNKLLDHLTLPDLLKHLEVPAEIAPEQRPVHFGGPVETARGFVLHTADYREEGTLVIGENYALTSTLEVLRALGRGAGPDQLILALGYAAWSPGQLDTEIQENVWLNGPAESGLVFGRDQESKWRRAIARIGIDPAMLSTEAGHA